MPNSPHCYHQALLTWILLDQIFYWLLILLIISLQLTVGFESIMQVNSDRKKAKYHSLISDLMCSFPNIKFIYLSMSSLGIFDESSDSLSLLEDHQFDKPASKYIVNTFQENYEHKQSNATITHFALEASPGPNTNCWNLITLFIYACLQE